MFVHCSICDGSSLKPRENCAFLCELCRLNKHSYTQQFQTSVSPTKKMDVYFQMSLHKEVVEVEVGKLIKKLVII